MKKPRTIVGLMTLLEFMGMTYQTTTPAPPPAPPPDPNDDLSLNDIGEEDSSGYQERAKEQLELWDIAMEVGGDRLKKAYGSACKLHGCDGTDPGDLTAEQHEALKKVTDIQADLSTSPQDASMFRLLNRLHGNAYWMLHDAEYCRIRDMNKGDTEDPTESQRDEANKDLDTPAARASAQHAMKNMSPGRRRALRALIKAKDKNKERIKKGEKPIIKGKEVSLAKFKAITKSDPKKDSLMVDLLSIVTEKVLPVDLEVEAGRLVSDQALFLEYNPYHGHGGKFSSAADAKTKSLHANKATKQAEAHDKKHGINHRNVMAGTRENKKASNSALKRSADLHRRAADLHRQASEAHKGTGPLKWGENEPWIVHGRAASDHGGIHGNRVGQLARRRNNVP